MPESGLLESGSVWAAGWRVLMQSQAAGAGEGAISEGGLRRRSGFSLAKKRVNIFFEFKQKLYLVPLLVIYSGTSKPS